MRFYFSSKINMCVFRISQHPSSARFFFAGRCGTSVRAGESQITSNADSPLKALGLDSDSLHLCRRAVWILDGATIFFLHCNFADASNHHGLVQVALLFSMRSLSLSISFFLWLENRFQKACVTPVPRWAGTMVCKSLVRGRDETLDLRLKTLCPSACHHIGRFFLGSWFWLYFYSLRLLYVIVFASLLTPATGLRLLNCPTLKNGPEATQL